jgi:hypothetical protein
MIEVGNTYNTWGGSQIVITKVGKRFIKAKVLAEGTLSLGVIRYLKGTVDGGPYCAFDEGVEYDFHEGLLSPKHDEWGSWVDCSCSYEMLSMTEGVESEIRFSPASHVTAYRLKRE